MEKIKINKKIAVHAYKYNGWLYRTWEFPTVIEKTDEYVCVSSINSRIITNRCDSKNHYKSKIEEPSIWYFFKDEWFNLIFQKRSNKLKIYINLASPFIYEEEIIKYIDFDLDYISNNFEKNHRLIRIDVNEFKINSNSLNYPNALKNKIIQTSEKIEKLFEERKLEKYFNIELLNKVGDKNATKKRLLPTVNR